MSTLDYLGQFDSDELRSGEGTQKYSKDEICRGNFVHDCPHGYAEYTWEGNVTYKGYFYMGQKEGYGCQTYPDGRVFHGLYKSNKRHGPGVQTYPTGHQDVGIWEDDNLIRLCTRRSLLTTTLPPLGQMKGRMRILESKPPRNRPMEILLDAGGQGLEEYVGYLCNPYVRQPKSLSMNHAFLQAMHRKGKPWGPDYRIVAWNNTDHMCDMQLYIFNNRHAQDETPINIKNIILNDRTSFCLRGKDEQDCLNFMLASKEGDSETVKKHLSKDIYPDVSDGEGNTALILASAYWEPEVVALLLDSGADINAINDEGFNPLLIALYRYFFEYKKVDRLRGVFAGLVKNQQITASQEAEPIIWTGEPTVIQKETRRPSLSRISRLTASRSKMSRLDMNKSEKREVPSPKSKTNVAKKVTTVRDEMRSRLLTLCSYSPYGWARATRLYQPKKYPIPEPFPQCEIIKDDSKEGHLPGLSSAFRLGSLPQWSSMRIGLPSWWVSETDNQSSWRIKKVSPTLDEATSRVLKTVELLLQRGANPNFLSGDVTPLTLAVRAGDLAIVNLLLKHGANPEQTLPEEHGSIAPIHLAANTAFSPDAPEIITSLVKAGSTVSRRVDPDAAYISILPERRYELAEWVKKDNFQLQGKQALHIACAKEVLTCKESIIRVDKSKAELAPIQSTMMAEQEKKYLAQDDYYSTERSTTRLAGVLSTTSVTLKRSSGTLDRQWSTGTVARNETSRQFMAGKDQKSKTNIRIDGSIGNGRRDIRGSHDKNRRFSLKSLDRNKSFTNRRKSAGNGRGEAQEEAKKSVTFAADKAETCVPRKGTKNAEEKRALLKTVKSLIQAGADVNEEVNGQNPLSLAIIHGNENLLPVLLGAGANPDKPLTMGTGSALGAAVSTDSERFRTFQQRKQIVETLLTKGNADLSRPFQITVAETGNAVDLCNKRIAQNRGFRTPKGDKLPINPELRHNRQKMQDYISKKARDQFLQKIKDIKAALMDPKLDDAKRKQFVMELRDLLFKSGTGSSTNKASSLDGINFCFQCGRLLHNKFAAFMCPICWMPFCTARCKREAMAQKHQKKECLLIIECRNMADPEAGLIKDEKRLCKNPKPILRRAVGYILTECRNRNVVLTPTDVAFYTDTGRENYSAN